MIYSKKNFIILFIKAQVILNSISFNNSFVNTLFYHEKYFKYIMRIFILKHLVFAIILY